MPSFADGFGNIGGIFRLAGCLFVVGGLAVAGCTVMGGILIFR